jgi:Secretion system C-terminal sorting domain
MKKNSFHFLFLLIAISFTITKVKGQCNEELAGTFTGNNSFIGTITLHVDTTNASFLIISSPHYIATTSFSNINCTNNTFSYNGMGHCSYGDYGWGTFSCDFNTIYLTYSYYVDQGEFESGPYYDTLARKDSIIIITTPACSGCNGTAFAALSGFSNNPNAHYSYLWSNGETTNPAMALCPGVYKLTVTTSFSGSTDDDYCPSNTTIAYAIIKPSALPALTMDFIGNIGGNYNSVEAIANNGISPYTYLWLPQDSIYNPATDLVSGTYTVIATSANGCATSDTVTIANNTVTLNNSNITHPANYIYPNPFGRNTTLSMNISQEYTLEVNDLSGRKIYSAAFSGNQYQLSAEGIGPGMYILRVFDINSNLVYKTKIAIQY